MRPAAKDLLELWAQVQTPHNARRQQWRLNAAYVSPREYPLWQAPDSPGNVMNNTIDTQARVVYDNTGIKSLPKYGAVLNKLMTPTGQFYHRLRATDTELMKIRAVRVFFNDLTKKIFQMRDAPRAGFRQSRTEIYRAIGTYGTAPRSIMWRKPQPDDRNGGFRYRALFIRDCFMLIDNDGWHCGSVVRFFLNARQFKQQFPNASTEGMKALAAELMKSQPNENTYFTFLHFVTRRTDYDKKSLGVQRHLYSGNYVCVEDACHVGEEEGFISDPYNFPRTDTIAQDPYGFSPAEIAFPALGGASAIKKTILKQGHKAVAPVILASDDGIMSGRLDMRPDRIVYGGLDRNGNPRVRAFENRADFRVAEQLAIDERKDIEDSFLVFMFQFMAEHPEMTAAEVYERAAEKASLADPTVARLQSEDLGPMIEREIALLAENGKMPEMPGELIEAQGEYSVVYSSPHARMMAGEGIAGYMRLKEGAIAEAQATGMQDSLDWYDTDEATPEMAEEMAVPPNWINDPEKVKAKRDARQKQQEIDTMVKAAPAAASVAKAAMDKGINPRA